MVHKLHRSTLLDGDWHFYLAGDRGQPLHFLSNCNVETITCLHNKS